MDKTNNIDENEGLVIGNQADMFFWLGENKELQELTEEDFNALAGIEGDDDEY